MTVTPHKSGLYTVLWAAECLSLGQSCGCFTNTHTQTDTPGRVAEALRADSPPRTRSTGTDHQRLEKTDSSPLSWP